MNTTWRSLDRWCDEYGDGFFVLDTDAFAANYDRFQGAFRDHYPRTTIGYSYKTNYLPPLGLAVQDRGGYAEVVSGMEYQLARRLGVPAERIIFNGPHKPGYDLEPALRDGSICNLDAEHEIDVVEQVAASHSGHPLLVGLRCNVDLGTGAVSRFGFDVDDPAFTRTVARIRGIDGCELAGLHLHVSTGDRSPGSYALRTKKLLAVTAAHFPDRPPRFVNVGGGYFGRMAPSLQAQFDVEIPDHRAYAAAIAPQVRAEFGTEDGPELVVEPGTALTADVLRFVTRVVSAKRVRGRSVALVEGSVHNIKPTGHGKAVPMTLHRADRPHAGPDGPVDLVGYTCMEHDVLAEGIPGPVAVGDIAVFDNVGAYTLVMQPPFIRTAPPVVAVRADGTAELVRRRQTTEDLLAGFALPGAPA
ncbi:hypothetical protein [Pseudonocardia sp. McavD-2-B]|uniref:hypothetical protein n=1 Tax=Pseudonocardia sp. McavD-2-B TaxID=2954499 RepID=UPI0020968BB4|nr:hypothetical protein [Pseudonocardia sp. McavD-2-B]MCO7193196.1 hypothetical protein [Pseudonocardia sp. McavD-2-B]